MSNFTSSQKFRTTNTSWRSRSYNFDNTPYNPLRGATSSSTADYFNTANISNKQHSNRTNIPQRTDSVTTSTAPSISGSCESEIGVPNSRQRNPLAQPRPYFAPRLSTDSNSDGGYLWPNKDRRNSNRHRNEQKKSNTWLRDSSRSSSGSTSSTESGIFSGDNSYSVNKSNSSNDRNKCLNFLRNHRNGWDFNIYPPGIPIPTPATHFASSQSFNAPAASSLPQPPQNWLFVRAKALVKEENLEEERALEKSSNTFDYYNLKMLLTVEA